MIDQWKILLLKMSKYWLVYHQYRGSRHDESVHGTNIVICDTKEEAIDIYVKASGWEMYEEDEEDGVTVEDIFDAIERKPYTKEDLPKKSKSKK